MLDHEQLDVCQGALEFLSFANEVIERLLFLPFLTK
jgi:hypothetical protein